MNTKIVGGVAIAAGAIALVYFLSRGKPQATAGTLRTGPDAKESAKRWLAAQLTYKGNDAQVNEVVSYGTAMESGREEELVKVIRRARGTDTYSHTPAFGIGRPL